MPSGATRNATVLPERSATVFSSRRGRDHCLLTRSYPREQRRMRGDEGRGPGYPGRTAEREEAVMSEMPGEGDREVYGEQSVDDEDQPGAEDWMLDRGLEDPLDEGYSPPEHEPAHLRHGVTREEMREGETLDERLAEEVPEPDPYADETDYGTTDPRAG